MFLTNDSNITPKIAPRLAIYSQDGFGLGHMRRTSAIATHLLARCPEGSALTLSDSPLGQFFPIAANHDYLKLPSIVKDGPGKWRPARLPLSFHQVQEMRKDLIATATTHFKPDIFLVDHMPHGSMGELLPTLKMLKRNQPETKIVLGLRDILDAPTVVEERWHQEGAYAAVEEFYDCVLVYGMHQIFDMVTQYRFPSAIRKRFQYCGYICPPITTRKQLYIDQHADQSEKKRIVVMAGGGADAYPMMAGVLDALPAVLSELPCHTLLITGPFMPDEDRSELQRRASNLPVSVVTSVEDTYSFIRHADLIIAMAGYNTSVEILQSNRPAILIPRRGPSAEQRMRANFFAEKQWVSMVDPDHLNDNRLGAVILANLNRTSGPDLPIKPDLEGITESANQLLALMPPPLHLNGQPYTNGRSYLNSMEHKAAA